MVLRPSESYDGVEAIAEVKKQNPDWDANFNWVGVACRSELACTFVGKLQRVQMVCDR